MNRNEFIKTCGSICVSTGAISMLLQSCGSIHYAPHTLEGNIIKVSKSEFVLEKNGKNEDRPFILVKENSLLYPICIYKHDNEATALLMQCTHQGCEVNPNPYSLVCPCHGSEFDTKGKVLNPPAEVPLTAYRVTQDNNNYYIQI